MGFLSRKGRALQHGRPQGGPGTEEILDEAAGSKKSRAGQSAVEMLTSKPGQTLWSGLGCQPQNIQDRESKARHPQSREGHPSTEKHSPQSRKNILPAEGLDSKTD